MHVVGISRRELTNRHESEALIKFFGYVTQTIVTHEKKACVHVVSIFRRELTSRLKARLQEIFENVTQK